MGFSFLVLPNVSSSPRRTVRRSVTDTTQVKRTKHLSYSLIRLGSITLLMKRDRTVLNICYTRGIAYASQHV